MRIGLDIDNVISDFDKTILKEFKKEDRKKRNSGIVNPKARHVAKLFDWSKEEQIDFFATNMEFLAHNLEVREGAQYYINQLLQSGHEIYLITHRVFPDYKNPKETTENWLSKNNISYTKLIFSESTDKSKECIENGIDIMFDDSTGNCKKLQKSGIPVCMMATELNYSHRGSLPCVRNWKELYEYILDCCEIKNVILDTDMSNEVDDQFALTYLMSSLERINLEAITIAPFSGSGYAKTKTLEEGTELSYQTTLKVLDMINKAEYKEKVWKGVTKYFHEASFDNVAIDKIIEICLKNKKTTIIAIGAITNIALAIQKEPKIIEKIEIVWLGGNSFLSHQNYEFNFKQDIEAVRVVFESKVRLTVIPCRNVASNLVTTTYELEHYLSNSLIGKYLCEVFAECKKSYYQASNDEIGSSKTLWDLSAIAYILDKQWFVEEPISCPNILENGMYENTSGRHEIWFVNDLFRNKIFKDYFQKMQKYNDTK